MAYEHDIREEIGYITTEAEKLNDNPLIMTISVSEGRIKAYLTKNSGLGKEIFFTKILIDLAYSIGYSGRAGYDDDLEKFINQGNETFEHVTFCFKQLADRADMEFMPNAKDSRLTLTKYINFYDIYQELISLNSIQMELSDLLSDDGVRMLESLC